MRSPEFTATALFAFVSLGLGRPQDGRLHTRDVADDFNFNLGATSNGLTMPSPSDFLPSSPDGGSYPSIGSPNVDFNALEPLSALPQPPAKNYASGSTGLPPGYISPLYSLGDGDSDPGMVVTPKFLLMQTEAVHRSIDSVSSGQFAYAIFGLASDQSSLVPTFFSNDNDWNTFAQKVRVADPGYVLHSLPDGILLISTYQADSGLEDKSTNIIYENAQKFFKVVHSWSKKRVFGYLVRDDDSLRDAVDSHSNASPIVLAPFSPATARYHLEDF